MADAERMAWDPRGPSVRESQTRIRAAQWADKGKAAGAPWGAPRGFHAMPCRAWPRRATSGQAKAVSLPRVVAARPGRRGWPSGAPDERSAGWDLSDQPIAAAAGSPGSRGITDLRGWKPVSRLWAWISRIKSPMRIGGRDRGRARARRRSCDLGRWTRGLHSPCSMAYHGPPRRVSPRSTAYQIRLGFACRSILPAISALVMTGLSPGRPGRGLPTGGRGGGTPCRRP